LKAQKKGGSRGGEKDNVTITSLKREKSLKKKKGGRRIPSAGGTIGERWEKKATGLVPEKGN